MGEATNLTWLDGFLNHQQYGYIISWGSGYFSLRVGIWHLLRCVNRSFVQSYQGYVEPTIFQGVTLYDQSKQCTIFRRNR